MKRRKTRGSQMVAALSDSRHEIAELVGASKTLVTYWANGDRRPGDDHIASLASEYGIPPSAWDEEPVHRPALPASTPTLSDTADADGQTGDQTTAALNRFIRQGLAELEGDPDLDAKGRAEAIKKLADAKVSLDRSTGENAITMQRIVVHPEFQRVVGLIVEAIRPYPEALDAAVKALGSA